MSDLHVLIIGAGVTGLLIAHGLKKVGIKYAIFETEPSSSHFRPREWSMGIHWSLPLLEALLPDDLKARLKEAQNDPFLDHPEHDIMNIYNGMDGSVLKSLPTTKLVRVSRRKMRAFCSQGIDVKYGYNLTDVKYHDNGLGVTATFANGESVDGTLVVGADGPRSKVRELLVGPEKAAVTPMDIVHCNVAVTYHDAEKAKFVRSPHPSFSLVTHPKIMSFIAIQDVPDENDPANWVFQVVAGWAGKLDVSLNDAGRLALVKERASVLSDPFKSAILWMPDDTKVAYNNISYWIPITWDNHDGRGTLAGDAAHPMPPHRGQGLNHAICDVSNFVAAMKKIVDGTSSLKDAITAYSDEVVKRGGIEVNVSRENALALMNWDKLMESPMMKRSLARSDIPVEETAA